MRYSVGTSNLCNLRIFDCIFYCSDNTPSVGLYLNGLNFCNISRNIFHSIQNYYSFFQGIVFKGSTANDYNINQSITDNHFYDIKDGIVLTHVLAYYNQSCGYRILNNTFIGLTGFGIYSAYTDWLQIEHNMMDFVSQPLMVIRTFNAKIKHNYFSAYTYPTSFPSGPYYTAVTILSDVTGTAYSSTNIEYTEIVGNRIFNWNKANGYGAGNDGIDITANGVSMNMLDISNNTIDNVITAIKVNNPTGTNVINFGTICCNKMQHSTYGIYLDPQTANNIVQNNSISCDGAVNANAILGGGVSGNIIKTNLINTYTTTKQGSLVASGNGTKKQWIIPHGLPIAPVWANAAVGDTSIALCGMYVQYDATNIYINFVTAPANLGYSNVVVNYTISSFY